MSISADDVRWVAKLARLDIGETDLAKMTEQLSAILTYVDQLKQVATEGVEPLAHPLKVHNVFRPDTPTRSLPTDAALSNAPDPRGDFFGVPAVLE